MRFPLEIIERIVAELADGFWTEGHATLTRRSVQHLQAFSLVSKDWRPAAQRLLFASRKLKSHVELNARLERWAPSRCLSLALVVDRESCPGLEGILKYHQSELAARMHDLLCFSLDSRDLRLYRDIAQLLLSATQLHTLSLIFRPTVPEEQALWDPERHSYHSQLEGLLSILFRMPNLRHLYLEQAALQTSLSVADVSMMPSPVANITLLALEGCALGDAELLTLIGPNSRITSLMLASLFGPSEAGFSTALARVAPQLRSLSLVLLELGSLSLSRLQMSLKARVPAMVDYSRCLPSILPFCTDLRKLQLLRFKVAAADLKNMEHLSELCLDFPDSLDLPDAAISRFAFPDQTWLPKLQVLDLAMNPAYYDEDISVWIRARSQERGIVYTVDAPSEACFEAELPEVPLVLTQTLQDVVTPARI